MMKMARPNRSPNQIVVVVGLLVVAAGLGLASQAQSVPPAVTPTAVKAEDAFCRGFRAQGQIYVTDLDARRVTCGDAQGVARAFVRTRRSSITVSGIRFRCRNDDFGEGAALASCRSGTSVVRFQYGYL